MTDKDILEEIKGVLVKPVIDNDIVSSECIVAPTRYWNWLIQKVEKLRIKEKRSHDVADKMILANKSLTSELEEVTEDRDSWKKIAEQLQDKWRGLEEELEEAKNGRDCWEQEAKIIGKNLENYKKATASINDELEAVKKEEDVSACVKELGIVFYDIGECCLWVAFNGRRYKLGTPIEDERFQESDKIIEKLIKESKQKPSSRRL